MTEALRILEAIKASSVTRIAFVDDAFDTPEIPEVDWGELLQYLSSAEAEQVCTQAGIDWEDWQAAIEGIQTTSREPVDELLQQLYGAYVTYFDPKFDPMGRFSGLKGPNLAYVRPLLELVRKASPDVTIDIYGSQMDEVDDQNAPHVVFVDLFLHSAVNPDETPDPTQAKEAVQKSLERIEPLLKHSPSIILMSSHPKAPEIKEYRKGMEVQNRVYASRFGFVDKKLIVADASKGTVNIDPQASDVLQDLFQTYKFGRGLHDTLGAWLDAARKAVESLEGDIDDLELADLAYLVRFRLSEEGQSLPDYLEWLLGECLLDEVGRKLDVQPKTPIDEEAKVIDGAFEGPTRKVAELYHRVRIEDKRNSPREHFRLGDLYLRALEGTSPHLIAIMNPDCDLVKRPGEDKPAAHAVITLRGKLENYQAPSTSVGDFIVINNEPKNIKWDYRAVETHPFKGALAKPGYSEGEFSYLGALRPLYAQEVQAQLLNKLGRVGVPVPPALAFASTVTLSYAAKGGKLTTINFADEVAPWCYFVPARQSDQEGILIFRRQFIRDLIAKLEQIDPSTLSPAAAGSLKNLLADSGRATLRELTAKGAELEKDICHGLILTKKKPKLGNQSANWACIRVSMKPTTAPAAAKTQPAEEVVVIAAAEPEQVVAVGLAEVAHAAADPAAAAASVASVVQ